MLDNNLTIWVCLHCFKPEIAAKLIIYEQIFLFFLFVILIMSFVYLIRGKKLDINVYFDAIFKFRKKSKLRIFWKNLLFYNLYTLGILYLALSNIAWYPTIFIRNIIKKILFIK